MSDRDLHALWFDALQGVADRAAHEIRDSLNGVSLNLEVVRSRSVRGGTDAGTLGPFATAAADQFETLSTRVESLLHLARPPRPGVPADVAMVLRHLAALLVPAARADGGSLEVVGVDQGRPSSAPPAVVRLALAAALLALVGQGGAGRCRLEPGSGAVVRFSHESAATCELDPAVEALIAKYDVKTERHEGERTLVLRFPGV